MRKYIITPVLLAIVCMVMCHCTFNRKASVAANEYLIQGELANLPDSIVIGLYEEDGNILNCVLRDTLMNGQFSFRDGASRVHGWKCGSHRENTSKSRDRTN